MQTGEKLVNRRKELGYTQAKLADEANVNVRTIRAYEQGTVDIRKGSIYFLHRLAMILECNISDLLPDEKI